MRWIFLTLLFATLPAHATQVPQWRTPDPNAILMIETAKGPILIELHGEFAPEAVARIVKLSRKGFFDGLPFYRVVDGFVAQAGQPDDEDNTKSGEANLPAEFTAKLKPDAGYVPVRTTSDGGEGFIGALPVAIVSAAESKRRNEGTVQSWGAYCEGTAGIARDDAFDSANSTFFVMRGNARRLERLYTVFGVVIAGRDVVQALAVGEPPPSADIMERVRILGDIAVLERPKIEIMETGSADFRALVDKTRAEKGADFTVCDVTVPVQVE